MGLYLRSSSLANPGNSITILPSALSYSQADGNFMYLLTNMSGSNISITGSTSIVGTLTTTGNITGNLIGTASWATNAINSTSASQATNAISASQASTASYAFTAINASQASTASYVLNAVSASYASNADLLDGKDSTIFATTGSNTFIGDQVITGSLTVSGSSTFTNIGNTILTGSLNITGSTTQTGNNTLIGNTVLSGSINVSGSQTFYGISAFYGNHTLSGSNTINGNTIMNGNIQVSGSSNFNNSEFIVTGSTSILGDFNVKGTSVFSNTTFTVTGSQYFTGSSFINGNQSLTGNSTVTGSLNVVGNINVVSGSSFTRWGNELFNYAQFANTASITVTQNVSGAFALPLTYFGEGISIVSGSRITFANTGLYNIQFSTLATQGNATATAHVWFRKTGSNIDNSDTIVTLQNNTTVPLAWNFLYPFSASEYAEILYHSNSAVTSFTYAAAGSGFPASPSIIVTVTQVA